MNDQNTSWSTYNTTNPLQVLAACADRLQNAEHLYNQWRENNNTLEESDKRCVVDWLRGRCKQYNDDVAKLTTRSVRVCAWDPFCKSAARDCGGFTPNGCKNYKNKAFSLPNNYKEILDRQGKKRTQEQRRRFNLKRKALYQAAKDDPAVEMKELKDQNARMICEMDVMQRRLDSAGRKMGVLKSENESLKEAINDVKKVTDRIM